MPSPDSIEATLDPIQVLVLEGQAVLRRGMISIINRDERLEVCAEAEDMIGAWEQFDRQSPDAALVDIRLPDGNGLRWVRRAVHEQPDLRVIVISMSDALHYAESALAAGARGYIDKGESLQYAAEAIRQAARDRIYISPRLARKFREAHRQAATRIASRLRLLPQRDREIFQQIGRGRNKHLIAESLGVKPEAVQASRHRIRRVLGIDRPIHLVRYAVALQLMNA